MANAFSRTRRRIGQLVLAGAVLAAMNSVGGKMAAAFEPEIARLGWSPGNAANGDYASYFNPYLDPRAPRYGWPAANQRWRWVGTQSAYQPMFHHTWNNRWTLWNN